MPHRTYIYRRLKALSEAEQIRILHQALELQQAEPQRQPFECIAKAMHIPLFPRLQSAQPLQGHRLLLTFDNGENGEADLSELLDPERPLDKALLEDEALFRAFEVAEGTLIWPEHGRMMKDFEGRQQFQPYSIDPGLLYEQAVQGAAAS